MKTKKSVVLLLFILSALILLGNISSVISQEKKKKKVALPAAVTDAFKKAYPKAVIKGIDKETTDGKEMFEVESVDGKMKRDLLYLPDGTVYEMEEGMAVKDLPKEIQESVKKEFPTGKVDKAEKLTRGAVLEYELVVKSKKDKYEVSLDPSGKILKNTKMGKKKEEKED